MQNELKNLIKQALKNLGIDEVDISLEHPADLAMGDYSTNVAMKACGPIVKERINTPFEKGGTWAVWLAGGEKNPKELAEKIVEELNKNKNEKIKEIKAVNGFINFYLSPEFFAKKIKEIISNKSFAENDLYKGKKIMIEYTQPNPFKPFHIGHLMSNAIGESISRLLEVSGAKVIRANYQGDVGPHVAKAIYGLQKFGLPSENKNVSEKAEYIGECYSKASNLYETDENIKKEIDEINKKIYEKSDPKINEIYEWGRKITLEAFEIIYKILGTKFDKYYFESAVAEIGQKIVKRNEKGIFERSDGAIVFHAEKYDSKLHTRVFINSQGLPTYETKELGLTATKFKGGIFSKKLDLSIVTTAVEQAEYMKVVSKAISILNPALLGKMKHITHGMMRFATGKMSSRKGNVVTGEFLIKDSKEEVKEKIKDRDFNDQEKEKVASIVGVAALKYSILKQAIGGDIIYDFEKSISFEGDSGPYLQYSYTRAKSILNKALREKVISSEHGYNSLEKFLVLAPSRSQASDETTFSSQKTLERLLYRSPEVVERAAKEFEPHYIANYLIELARAFNAFYGNTQIVKRDDPASPYKVALTEAVSVVMKDGLYLLGIEVPEKM